MNPTVPPPPPDDFSMFGGVPSVLMGADPNDPINVIWNFGVVPATDEVKDRIRSKPHLYARFPNVQGKWDGKSTVNHVDAIRKVNINPDDLIQYQPRGTCGGRSGSALQDVLQCVMISMGKRAIFKSASHAWLYWQARKRYNMDNGNPNNDRDDGVASGSIPEVMTTMGLCSREETGDTNQYGQGSDDLACLWGAGRIDSGLARQLEELAKDNVVTEWAPVNSAAEAADGIAAGGILIGADNRGFTTQRNAEGLCSPRGAWSHYHIRVSIQPHARHRGVFGYWQSWGKNTPTGPLLPGHPSNCFGVDWETQDRCIRSGDYAIVFGMPPFELEKQNYDIPWRF